LGANGIVSLNAQGKITEGAASSFGVVTETKSSDGYGGGRGSVPSPSRISSKSGN